MSFTKFHMFNRKYFYADRDTVLSVFVLFISAFTYLSTIEPTAGFWDCGEFIASSYKLEVGHPPGNPVFQIIARFFTLFADKEHAAMMVNAMSGLCSAFTIYFLYLTIILLGRRMDFTWCAGLFADKAESGGEMRGDTPEVRIRGILVSGAALIGSLAYCFSDTFWFSAVESEVYSMSSLFTAVVFWAMLKWEKEADTPYSGRWIILIAFLMGVSIGVHLLNLLTIPALVFIYYYKKYKVTVWGHFKVMALSGIILAAILYGIIPYLPKAAAYTDMFFLNVIGMPVNTGAVLFVLLVVTAGFAGIHYTYKKRKILLNTVLLALVMIIAGYSVFAVTVIRAGADTPTNEYNPDNPFTLIRYLEREQYGSKPLIYGETFASRPTDMYIPHYYNYYDGKYIKLKGPGKYIYDLKDNMLFSRMWSGSEPHVAVYKSYTGNRPPSFRDNLRFFWDYQMDFMYIRYFMWNFAGRQNDLHAVLPGDNLKGNWESGIGFIDKFRLGEQEGGPGYISASRAKNHYYFLPLILGIIGMFGQMKRDRRGWFTIMLLFILTGAAIVVYINQTPLQVRERDYAYAGSFYAFCIWIGFAVFPAAERLKKLSGRIKEKYCGAAAWGMIGLLSGVPVLMASENLDDHDRSGRYTAREMAYNILAPLDINAVLVTHTDNDTFPLWYLQEVEGIRTDVRIMNTSLLGMDWYINQMRRKTYDSDPVELSIDKEQYFYGTNDITFIDEKINRPVNAREVIDVFKNPRITIQSPLMRGGRVNFIAARKIVIPVDREKVMENGIVPECDYDKIADSVVLSIPDNKYYLSKDELIILDMLSCYNWDRPLYFLGAGEVNIGINEWLQFEGFAYRFVPVKSDTGVYQMNPEQADLERVYTSVKSIYDWRSLGDTSVNIDYQNLITFSGIMAPRLLMVTAAEGFYRKLMREEEIACDDMTEQDIGRGDSEHKIKGGKAEPGAVLRERGVELLDMAFGLIPDVNIPLSTLALDPRNDINTCKAVNLYLAFGEKEKGLRLAGLYFAELKKHMILEGMREQALRYIYTLAEILNSGGEKEAAEDYIRFSDGITGE